MIYIDDGKVVGIVTNISDDAMKVEIKIGGFIRHFAQVRFVGSKQRHLPLVTDKDLEDIEYINKVVPIDFISLPFVSSANDIITFRKQLTEKYAAYKAIKIIPKVDSMDAVQKFEEILDESDGTIITRNELQYEFHAEKLVIA